MFNRIKRMFNRENQPYGKESIDAGVPGTPWYRRPLNWVMIVAGLASVGLFTAAMIFAWPVIVGGLGYAAVFTAVGAGFGIPSAYALGVGGTILGLSTLGTAVSLFVGIRKLCTSVPEKRRTASVSVSSESVDDNSEPESVVGTMSSRKPNFIVRTKISDILKRKTLPRSAAAEAQPPKAQPPKATVQAPISPQDKQVENLINLGKSKCPKKVLDSFINDLDRRKDQLSHEENNKRMIVLVEQLKNNFNYETKVDKDRSKIELTANQCIKEIFEFISEFIMDGSGIYTPLNEFDIDQKDRHHCTNYLLDIGVYSIVLQYDDNNQDEFLRWLAIQSKRSIVEQRPFIPEQDVPAPRSPRSSFSG